MSPENPKRRAADALWVRILREFGLPTVIVLWGMWTTDRDKLEERKIAATRETRLVTVIASLQTSIDASAAASRELSARVALLETLGRDAMLVRHPQGKEARP